MATRSFNRHIPNEAHDAVKQLAEDADIRVFAFTRQHGARGWLVVNEKNEREGSNLPVKLVRKLEEFDEANSQIAWVAFPGSGNRWSILLENGFFNRRVPDDLHAKMHELHNRGHRFKCLAFPRNRANGWALVTDRSKRFYSRDIPDECQVIASNINQGARKVHHVSFTPAGGWFLAAGDYIFARNIGSEVFSMVNDFRDDGRVIHSVTFDLDGDGWSVISNETFSSKPSDPLRGFESRVNNRTIWEEMRRTNAPGASVAIIRNNEILAGLGYGHQKRGDDRAARPATLFQAASISKVVTAIGVMRAVEKGLLDLDKPVRSVRGFNLVPPDLDLTHWNDCTLRRLLAHMGGIAGNDGGQKVGGYNGYRPTTELPSQRQILSAKGADNMPDEINPGRTAWMVYNPGTERRYSGPGYQIVQALIAEASGERFPKWMQHNVLDPLNMLDSFFNVEIPQKYFDEDMVAAGHLKSGSILDGERRRYPQYAAAGLYSTAIDLAKIIIMMNQNGFYEGQQFLSAASVTTLLTPHDTNVSPRQALGWRLNQPGQVLPMSHDNFRYRHGGTNLGLRSWMVGYPNQDNGAGLVVMSNTDWGGFRFNVGQAIIDRFGWK